ncbi:MlaA family lipoprotein [Gluconacetobacter tumulicola]|uniref:VacJ family lipoprotein n=1 Tax=Gluconacetobacter tumulicola TaxID=1017177 RepID=A0A7W4P7W4_9PROT|nr:VacJ family lipoprotein [Gluconacetobacter tumulicola]MBB2180389.1 VacJ family lipoprotein [Gluconacetobacter tumulicola]
MQVPQVRSSKYILFFVPAMFVAGCAHNKNDLAANDPAEPTNRTVFGGNLFVDHHVLRPVARTYAANVPGSVKHGVHNFSTNLNEPKVLVNDVLQGNFSRSWNTLERFTINSTVGVLGIFDFAQLWGMPYHNADFGQTLGVWGIGPGPDVQLPLMGFSNVRDATGSLAGIVLNPTTFVSAGVVSVVRGASSGLGVVDGRADTLAVTDDVERNSLDEYASLRAMTTQHRAAFIQEGIQGKVKPDDLAAAANQNVISMK